MSFYTMADNNVPITANRDGALYNVALSNQSFIIKDMGTEYAPSVSGLRFSVGTGIAVLKGRHVTSTEVTEDNSIDLPQNSTGYVVLRLDLSRPIGTEAYLYATPSLTQENINWSGVVYDLPIATFTSTLTNASIEDVRVIIESAGGGAEITEETPFKINGTNFNFISDTPNVIKLSNGVKFDGAGGVFGIDTNRILANYTNPSANASAQITLPADLGAVNEPVIVFINGTPQGVTEGQSIPTLNGVPLFKNTANNLAYPPFVITIFPNDELKFKLMASGKYMVFGIRKG